MIRKKRMLILGPSFRRNKSSELLPAINRYDGLFFRITRNYLSIVKDIDSIIMIDDLTLVVNTELLPHKEPEGDNWRNRTLSHEIIERARMKNKDFLIKKFRNKKYSEVFLAMGKKYAKALPDLKQFQVNIQPSKGRGIGPKAQALKEWMTKRVYEE